VNLLDNAVKFTDEGEVRVETVEQSGVWELHVRDTCPGLSPEELATIFEPFQRGVTSKPGSGLGLTIARRTVEAQGGAIGADSSGERGCHFWIRLPRA
jgi:signal transduction histidine kinase